MGRTIVIGDIHGCWDELQALLDRVALTDDDVVVSVGDLVDRGPDPGAVVAWFRQRKNAVVVCGNHERKHVKGTFSYSQDVCRLQMGASYADDVAWMAGLPYSWENDQVSVVHAARIPGVSLADTPDDVLCGTTSGTEKLEKRLGGRWWHELVDEPKPVVFGHHVVGPDALIREGRAYGIDTGACHGMFLTALVLPSFQIVSVPARADHWRTVRRAWQVPVLRARDWTGMPFAKLESKAAELARGADPDAVAYLDGVRAWSDRVRASIPTLAAAADARIAGLTEVHGDGFQKAVAGLPGGNILIRRRAGKLSDTHLGCETPADVLRLAGQLGVAIEGAGP